MPKLEQGGDSVFWKKSYHPQFTNLYNRAFPYLVAISEMVRQ